MTSDKGIYVALGGRGLRRTHTPCAERLTERPLSEVAQGAETRSDITPKRERGKVGIVVNPCDGLLPRYARASLLNTRDHWRLPCAIKDRLVGPVCAKIQREVGRRRGQP